MTRPENPKHYAGAEKLPFADVSGIVMAELGLAMHEGARKYGAFNYRETPIRASDYYNAFKRHITQWWELREDPDPTCGVSHLVKAMACLAVLRDAEINGMLIDDRPPAVDRGEWERLEDVAEELRKRHPEPKARVTEWGAQADAVRLTPAQRDSLTAAQREALEKYGRSISADVELGTYPTSVLAQPSHWP